jgi:hypothetical protein
MNFRFSLRQFHARVPLGGAWMILIALAANESARADTLILAPSQDTYLSEAAPLPAGTGPDMIIGTQGAMAGFVKTRGLIQFDLASIPAGATIQAVTLRLTVTRVPLTPASSMFQLHRLLQPWDDLESTWTLRLEPDENWAAPGGQEGADYAAAASSSVLVGAVGAYTFASTPQLVADVTAWLANPAANHGWLMKTEDESVSFTARRIASREALAGGPVLEVQFEPPPPPLRIESTAIAGGGFCVRFTAKAGKTYTLERRERVDTGNWTVVATRPPSDETAEATLCDPLAAEGNRFYRVGEQ